ncbi:MAG: type VI secretion system tip protein TssI/VgrG [Myxococcota bacterium]
MAPDGSAGTSGDSIERVTYELHCLDAPSAEFTVVHVRVVEALNRPYEIDLEVATDDTELEIHSVLGASIELHLSRGEHARLLYGVVSEVEYVSGDHQHQLVQLRVVPAFRLLDQTTRSQIFQDMSVVEILDAVLAPELGAYARTLDLSAVSRGTAPRDYCVQYDESDFAFACRLMEEEGITYRLVHDEDAGHEVLVATDDNTQYPDAANVDGSSVVPIAGHLGDTAGVESLLGIGWRTRLRPTGVARHDYDFLTPTRPLIDETGGADERGRPRRFHVHMRRRYITDDVGQRVEDLLESQRVDHEVVAGHGNMIGFSPGMRFELERHELPELERAFILTEVVHEGHQPDLRFGSFGARHDGHAQYENRFCCVPDDVPLRPRAITPKPRIYGPQTAIVSGPGGEEIHTDEHGRICVQFHWPEQRAYDDTSGCWVRVAQSWAGAGWGAQFIPRIGMEVVVEFLEGNPDRPLVTGCVYNGDNSPPFSLPDSKTQSGIRTNSSIGSGSNELRFEDAAGAEELFIHAQKDQNSVVENDQTHTVHNDQTITIDNDRTKVVHNNQSETVDVDKSITVGGNHTESVTGDYSTTVGGSQTLTVGSDRTMSIGANLTETIGSALATTVATTHTLTVGAAAQESVGAAKNVSVGAVYAEEVGAARSIAAGGPFSVTAGSSGSVQCGTSMSISAGKDVGVSGGTDVSVSSGKKMTLQSGDDLAIAGQKKASITITNELTIKCGSATIQLKKDGTIAIKGKKISVNGTKIKIDGSSKVAIN